MDEDHEYEDTFWSGFITRNKLLRVGVDMKLIRQNKLNKDVSLNEYHLNVSHRANFEEAFKKEPSALVVLTASNDINKEIFTEYVKYFKEK